MEIHLTKHCKQRRNHYPTREDYEILSWINYFIDLFKLNEYKDGFYRIKYKNNFSVIKIKKNRVKKKLVVITFAHFTEELFEQKDKITFQIKDITKDNEKIIWRSNFVNRSVRCGTLTINKDKSIRLKFKKSVFDKYIVETNGEKVLKGFKYKSNEDIDCLDNINGRLFINFKRKQIEGED